jgi:cytochrome c551/c552
MQAVFEHQSKAGTALEQLAGMRGDPAKGETIFKEHSCRGCHWPPKDSAPSVETLRSYDDRVRIIQGILNPGEKGQAHSKSMPNGILSTMSSEEFLDVVEYLNSPPPRGTIQRLLEEYIAVFTWVEYINSIKNLVFNNIFRYLHKLPYFYACNDHSRAVLLNQELLGLKQAFTAHRC